MPAASNAARNSAMLALLTDSLPAEAALESADAASPAGGATVLTSTGAALLKEAPDSSPLSSWRTSVDRRMCESGGAEPFGV